MLRQAGGLDADLGSISPTDCSRSGSSSSTRMRAGCPSVLKNSALSWYSGVLTRLMISTTIAIANFSKY